MWREVPALLCAGLACALLELCWGFGLGHRLFLGQSERLGYAALALTALPAICTGLGVALGQLVLARRTWKPAALLVAGLATLAAYELTEGRRVRDLAVRPVLVLALGALGGFIAWRVLGATARARTEPQAQRWFVAGSLSFVLVLIAVDALVLVRVYPAFHVALTLLAISSMSLVGVAFGRPQSERLSAAASALAVVLLLLSPFMAMRLRSQPNASFVVERVAPWSGKLLTLAARLERRTAPIKQASSTHLASTAQHLRGIDLRDRDVLLITVDALRADLLTAYGGRGLTPQLDALAKDSLVFRRAYTVAPHTSYALASLLTAKFLKPVLEMHGASADPPTLPDLLRRYGYRTAAFYPPAIFFVDGARFDALRNRGFGFEYRKEMFASAGERAKQIEAYLTEADPQKPVFAWVHLFEPHEPYDPPPELVHEDSARGRYEAEVAVCDRAIGDLLRAFRAKRPGATIIVSADHGEEFGDHGGHYHGTTVFDEQVRVPLLWSSPGVVRPGVTDAPVELVDVGTSVLSAAGVPREARMRGDDLGALLAGEAGAGPPLAFAAVEDRHMVTDGHLKAICVARETQCQLFDLDQDPRELRNLAAERAADLTRLRSGLDAFLTSIPKVEALGVDDGVAFPAALTRARLGAPGAGPEVVPLLADARASVRIAAARTLGELRVAAAAMALDRLRLHDPDPAVRAEAAVASLLLGSDLAADDVRALLTQADAAEGLSLARRAALALARLHDPAALPVLSALAHDEAADELDRLRAVKAVADVGTKAAAGALIDLLANVRLRSAVAEALGRLGGRPAANALASTLRKERYQTARQAEARALQHISDPRTAALVTHVLGMETSVPDGVRILLELGHFKTPKASGAALASESVRRGAWECDAQSCAPGADAFVELPKQGMLRGSVRVTWLVTGEVGSTIEIDGEPFKLKASEEQFSFLRDGRSAQRFAVAPTSSVRVVALSVVPARPEIPAPPPEPWEAEKSVEGTP